MKQKLTVLEKKFNDNSEGDFNVPPSIMVRTTSQKINK